MSNYGCMGLCKLHGTPDKPQRCQEWPKASDILPSKCTYYFENGKRQGTCQPNVCQEEICCAQPRDRGEPNGKFVRMEDGGLPCKHLEWHFSEEPEHEKNASTNEDYTEYNNYRNLLYRVLSGDDI